MRVERPVPWSVALLLGLLACTGDSFTVAPGGGGNGSVDLAGRWLLKDSSVATVAFFGAPYENACITEGEGYDLTAGKDDTLWVAQQVPGGTYTCMNDGDVYASGNLPFTDTRYDVVQRGDSVLWFRRSGNREYLGKVRAADDMTGPRDSTYNGRRGRWWAERE